MELLSGGFLLDEGRTTPLFLDAHVVFVDLRDGRSQGWNLTDGELLPAQ